MKEVNVLLFACLTTLLFGCKQDFFYFKKVASTQNFVIKPIEVLKENIVLNPVKGTWYHKNKPYSGYMVKYHTNDTLAERTGFYKGKRQGVSRVWSPDGQLRLERIFYNNRISGDYKVWWENGVLAEQSTYIKGIMQGVQKKWYPSGVLSKVRNITDGKEKGRQQAWLENGKLYVNYEVINGRVFGLNRANTCYTLKNEKIVTK